MSDWRQRVRDALSKDGRSYRAILKEARLGPSFITENIVSDNPKDPSLGNLRKLCDALGVSLAYIVTGLQVTPEAEEMLEMYSQLPDSDRQAMLRMARGMATSDRSPEEPAPAAKAASSRVRARR